MANEYRIKQAKGKLERLEREFTGAVDNVFAHQRLTNGQPMNDKRNGQAWFNRQEALEGKASRLNKEIEAQKERIYYLEQQALDLEQGYDRYGRGLRMTVENIPRIEEELAKAEKGESRFTDATIRKYKKELVRLKEEAKELETISISDHFQELIDEGELNQWKKQPKIYFIKGLRKVALELQSDGSFKESTKYKAKTEDEKAIVQSLLAD